jgi:hypothetical protein
VTRIHSVAGLLSYDQPLVEIPPFRAPHHSASTAAVVGGGPGIRPGEASLAHRGVLLLDELAEFPRPTLEALRQPLEDGFVCIARAAGRAIFPARFQLVATVKRSAVCRVRTCTRADPRPVRRPIRHRSYPRYGMTPRKSLTQMSRPGRRVTELLRETVRCAYCSHVGLDVRRRSRSQCALACPRCGCVTIVVPILFAQTLLRNADNDVQKRVALELDRACRRVRVVQGGDPRFGTNDQD